MVFTKRKKKSKEFEIIKKPIGKWVPPVEKVKKEKEKVDSMGSASLYYHTPKKKKPEKDWKAC